MSIIPSQINNDYIEMSNHGTGTAKYEVNIDENQI
jgi:hypothetical protein